MNKTHRRRNLRYKHKKDLKGRRYHKVSEREAILAEYDKSDLTQLAFAEREGIRFNTFTTWLVQKGYQSQTTTNFA